MGKKNSMHSWKSVLIPTPIEYRIRQRTFICAMVDVCLIMTELWGLGRSAIAILKIWIL
ncbi:MAG: hypothetical protein AAF349_07525 [Cyanobacteria bacterium P01_A01_bin.68]